jgi:hypothetical protein
VKDVREQWIELDSKPSHKWLSDNIYHGAELSIYYLFAGCVAGGNGAAVAALVPEFLAAKTVTASAARSGAAGSPDGRDRPVFIWRQRSGNGRRRQLL